MTWPNMLTYPVEDTAQRNARPRWHLAPRCLLRIFLEEIRRLHKLHTIDVPLVRIPMTMWYDHIAVALPELIATAETLSRPRRQPKDIFESSFVHKLRVLFEKRFVLMVRNVNAILLSA